MGLDERGPRGQVKELMFESRAIREDNISLSQWSFYIVPAGIIQTYISRSNKESSPYLPIHLFKNSQCNSVAKSRLLESFAMFQKAQRLVLESYIFDQKQSVQSQSLAIIQIVFCMIATCLQKQSVYILEIFLFLRYVFFEKIQAIFPVNCFQKQSVVFLLLLHYLVSLPLETACLYSRSISSRSGYVFFEEIQAIFPVWACWKQLVYYFQKQFKFTFILIITLCRKIFLLKKVGLLIKSLES